MKKCIWTIALGVLVAVLITIVLYYKAFESLHYRFARLLYTSKEASKDIIIVTIDNKSIADSELGKFKFWTRGYYSKVINFLTEGGAKAIALDLLSTEKSQGISQLTLQKESNLKNFDVEPYVNSQTHPYDQEFADALQQSKRVILAKQALETHKNQNEYVLNVKSKIDPLPIFKKNALTAWINIGELKDNRIFSFPVGYRIGSEFEESFAFLITRKFLEINQKPSLNQIKKDTYRFYQKPKIIVQLNENEISEDAYPYDIQIPIENGEMLINFATLPESPNGFQKFSFTDVYFERIPKDTFKDKIVLIGPYNPTSHDEYLTPLSDDFMYGIEIHANAIQTILDQKFLAPQKFGSKILMLFLITLLTVLIFSYTPLILSLLYLPIGLSGYFYLAKWQFENGLMMDMIHPFLAIAISFVAIYLYKYLSEYKGKLQLKNAFSHYVNPTVVKEIMKHPDKLGLGGEKREVTVFFSDVKGFTSVSEKLSPEALVGLLNEYLATMSDVILGQGGTIDKYEGDAIMAFWNAPLSQENHALLACQTALLCRQALKKLHLKWKNEGNPLLDFRVGISTGDVIVGNVGSENRFEYTIIGDTVNLGARLESANKFYGTNIMISQFTAEKVCTLLVLRPTDLLKVKGKEKPVMAYEIVCLKEELTTELQNFLNEFEKAFSLYVKGIFSEAHKILYSLNQKFPQDPLTKVYLLRCGEFIKNRPANWNGVWEWGEK